LTQYYILHLDYNIVYAVFGALILIKPTRVAERPRGLAIQRHARPMSAVGPIADKGGCGLIVR
jgi:hypothetical protein